MKNELNYGLTKAGKLRLFTSQIMCSECSDRMIIAKKDKSQYVCRIHQDCFRKVADVEQERIYFECIKERLISLGIQEIMTHEMDLNNYSRGQFVNSTSVSYMADPSFSIPFFMAAAQVLRDIGQDNAKYLIQLPLADGLFGLTWRFVNYKTGDVFRIIESSCNLIKKGFYANGYIIEAVISKDDASYANAQEIIHNQDLFSGLEKEEAISTIKSYKTQLPRR